MVASPLPAISILIPARNAEQTLNEALASIAAQTFADWEAIVVDDGSTDATAELLSAWVARDARFRVLRNETGTGIVAALNRALAEAEENDLAVKAVTPYLLERIFHITEGRSLRTNIALVENNAHLSAEIAVAMAM